MSVGVPHAAGVPEVGKFWALCPGLHIEDPFKLAAGLERVDLFKIEGLASEPLELGTFPGLHIDDFIAILFGLETGDFTLQ